MANEFGSDIYGLMDCDKRLSWANDSNVLASDLIGRLVDTLWYDDTYGFPLERLLINSSIGSLATVGPQIEAELLKDDRVDQVKASISSTQVPGDYTMTILVVPSDGTEFKLVANLSSLGLTDLQVINT